MRPTKARGEIFCCKPGDAAADIRDVSQLLAYLAYLLSAIYQENLDVASIATPTSGGIFSAVIVVKVDVLVQIAIVGIEIFEQIWLTLRRWVWKLVVARWRSTGPASPSAQSRSRYSVVRLRRLAAAIHTVGNRLDLCSPRSDRNRRREYINVPGLYGAWIYIRIRWWRPIIHRNQVGRLVITSSATSNWSDTAGQLGKFSLYACSGLRFKSELIVVFEELVKWCDRRFV